MRTLRVGAAFPDPPFNGMPDDGGLDIDLMAEIAKKLGMDVEFIPYDGADFNGIFDGLDSGTFDCVAAGHDRHPRAGEESGIRPALPHLGTVARRRHQTAARGEVRRRPRRPDHRRAAGQHQPADRRRAGRGGKGGPRPGLRLRRTSAPRSTDLTTGGCDAFMKLAPVLTELVKPIAGVEVVQRGISVENIAIAVGAGRPGTARPGHGRSGRAEPGRDVAAIATEMAG